MSGNNFIQSLIEARVFRYAEDFEGKKVSTIGECIFAMMLMLESMRRIDPEWAKRYARDTLLLGNFEGVRSYGTDLHNLIALLTNPASRKKLTGDKFVYVPEFALKRYFRDLMNGTRPRALDRQMFIQIENDLAVVNSNLNSARRSLVSYPEISSESFQDAVERVSRVLNNLAINTDLQFYYKNNVRYELLQNKLV